MSDISKLHKVPITEWLSKGLDIKFVGDNVDKKVGVRDLRSDHRGEMAHMYSMLVVKSRVSSSNFSIDGSSGDLMECSASHFLPSRQDLAAIKGNLIVLVSRVLCKYITALKPLTSAVTKHIIHNYSTEMSFKSDVHVVDVLMKNEAVHADMIEIMQHQQSFIRDNFPIGHKILSGGDHMTCERQVGAQHQLMDGDTPRERLGLLEPQVEDWHALMNYMLVNDKFCDNNYTIHTYNHP